MIQIGEWAMGASPVRDEGVRQLFDLIRRVNSSTDTAQVLTEIVAGVVDKLGFGLAAIARLEADTLVVQAFAGPDSLRSQLMGRRTPKEAIEAQFRLAECWGILRYVPHDRVDQDFLENAWIPEYDPIDAPDAWHPEDALYAPLYSATGELVGNMAVDFPPEGRIPSQGLRELLELFVVQAGLALSNAQQRERLAEQFELGRIIKDVALGTGLRDIDATLIQAAQTITHGFGSLYTWIQYFPDSSALHEECGAVYPPLDVPDGLPNLALAALLGATESGEPTRLTLNANQVAQLDHGDDLHTLMRKHPSSTLLAVPLSAGDEILGYLALLHDRDVPKSSGEHAALSEIARELGRLILNYRVHQRERRLVTELQQLDRYKDDLIATISHELKTPLTSIMGHAELLEGEGDSLRPSVLAIRRNAQRLNTLVANLLDYSRVQNDRDSLRRPVDIVETVRNSLELHDLQARALGVRCTLTASSSATVYGDPDELGRVVDNLIGNAIKYSPNGGDISITVESRDAGIEVAVADHGLGISEDDQTRLFSPFHRSRNPDALAIPGTGLGLAIAHRVAILHGGDISVDSELGAGSTFRLWLPTGLSR